MANYGELLLATAMGERMALDSAAADINRIIDQCRLRENPSVYEGDGAAR
jgi:hypothetical protein